jgi:hypothetical protein
LSSSACVNVVMLASACALSSRHRKPRPNASKLVPICVHLGAYTMSNRGPDRKGRCNREISMSGEVPRAGDVELDSGQEADSCAMDNRGRTDFVVSKPILRGQDLHRLTTARGHCPYSLLWASSRPDVSGARVSIDSMYWCHKTGRGDLHVVVRMNFAVHNLAVDGC